MTFEALLTHDLIDEVTAQRVRDEATAVTRRIEQGREPFDEAWIDWRPEPSWPVPELPDGWDSVEVVYPAASVGPGSRGGKKF